MKVCIAGGGRVGRYLAQSLLANHHSVVIIEPVEAQCRVPLSTPSFMAVTYSFTCGTQSAPYFSQSLTIADPTMAPSDFAAISRPDFGTSAFCR